LTDRRVPNLSTDGVLMRFDESGDLAGFALRNRVFFALPDDPHADHRDCAVLASPDALRDRLREQFITHLMPLVDVISARSSVGRPGLWALAADYCASAFTWIGKMVGVEAGAADEARALAAAPSLLRRKRDYIFIKQGDMSYYLVDRISCCHYFKVPEGHYCSSCPHRPREERVGLIKEWMTRLASTSAAA
jgi:ferric iron reductase protein FhuF